MPRAIEDRTTVALENRIAARKGDDELESAFWRHKKAHEWYMEIEQHYIATPVQSPIRGESPALLSPSRIVVTTRYLEPSTKTKVIVQTGNGSPSGITNKSLDEVFAAYDWSPEAS